MSLPEDTGFKMSIALTLEQTALSLFAPLLQGGIQVRAALPSSVQSFLCDQIGLEPDYVREKILSIVLDGHPVDDTEKALLRNGSRLALSSGMPGLAGAALRRGSPLASFRGSITHRESAASGTQQEGVICVKLFNLMMVDLGPRFLQRGIRIESGAFVAFLRQNGDPFLEKCLSVDRNGTTVEPKELAAALADGEEELLLSVILTPERP